MKIKTLKKPGNMLWIVFRTILVAGICFFILYPVFVKLTTSFKSSADMVDPTVLFLPKEFTFSNFVTVFRASNYPRILLNTILFCSLVALLQVFSCSFVAYGFARFRFPGRNLFFSLCVCTLIIPPQVLLLPLYLKFRFFNIFEIFKFGGTLSGTPLIDTPWPFILMSLMAAAFKNGLFIFLLRQHFRNLPSVLEEAAYVDGCGVFKTFFRIMLPGAVPMMITVFLFSFVWQWNDYYYTTILAPSMETLNMKLMGMSFSQITSILGDMSTSALQSPKFFLLIVPPVILYLILQKRFTESIVKSGIVG